MVASHFINWKKTFPFFWRQGGVKLLQNSKPLHIKEQKKGLLGRSDKFKCLDQTHAKKQMKKKNNKESKNPMKTAKHSSQDVSQDTNTKLKSLDGLTY